MQRKYIARIGEDFRREPSDQTTDHDYLITARSASRAAESVRNILQYLNPDIGRLILYSVSPEDIEKNPDLDTGGSLPAFMGLDPRVLDELIDS